MVEADFGGFLKLRFAMQVIRHSVALSSRLLESAPAGFCRKMAVAP
jgi:hypothetical protein